MEKNGNLPYDDENIVSREETVAGQKVEVLYDKDDTEFANPKGAGEPVGMEGEELDQWKEEAGNEFKMKTSANTKYDEAAKLRREIEKEKADLNEQRKELEKMKEDMEKGLIKAPTTERAVETEKPDFYKILSDLSGEVIKTVDDEIEFEEDNRRLYMKAKKTYEKEKDKYLLSQANRVDPSDIVQKTLLRSRIEQAGHDYDRVKHFAKLRGWKVNQYSYDAFKNANPKRKSTTDKINKYAQQTDFIWIPPKGTRPSRVKQTLEDEFDSRDELEEYVEAELEKENPDPRALKFMEMN